MRDILFRLARSPLVVLELAIATLFANMLALGQPIFSIQVLNATWRSASTRRWRR